jgi:hypothetical protein
VVIHLKDGEKKIAANKQQQYSMSLKLANNVVTAETAQLTIPDIIY